MLIELIDEKRIHVSNEYEAESVLTYYEKNGFNRVDELRDKAYYEEFPYLGKIIYPNAEFITAYSKCHSDDQCMEYSEWERLVKYMECSEWERILRGYSCNLPPVDDGEMNLLLFS